MFKNIVESIISTEFQNTFGRGRVRKAENDRYHTDPNNAMEIRFELSPEYDREEGYRHLKILIFGGGSNYISVFSKVGWNVASYSALEANQPDPYVGGDTGWVLEAHHDSCWREAIGNVLRRFDRRILTIGEGIGGANQWFKTVTLSQDDQTALIELGSQTQGYAGDFCGVPAKVEHLEFRYPDPRPGMLVSVNVTGV